MFCHTISQTKFDDKVGSLHFCGLGGSLVSVMNRRKFLCSTVATAAVSAFPKILQADAIPSASARLTIQANQPGQAIPGNFLGLSYETAQLSDPEYFSLKNDALAGFLRPLGRGVLRIGGNSSEYAFWTPKPTKGESAGSSAPDWSRQRSPSPGKHADHAGIDPQSAAVSGHGRLACDVWFEFWQGHSAAGRRRGRVCFRYAG